MPPEIIVGIITGAATIVAALIGLIGLLARRERAQQSRAETETAAGEKSGFWDVLSDTIVIVYGAEYPGEAAAGDHPQLSPRDLRAAETILAYLSRTYPDKTIVPLQSFRDGWQALLRDDTDLVIIGGFAANLEFDRHRLLYQQDYRLKMGRLCRVDGRRVYHVGLAGFSDDAARALRRRPQAIEDLPATRIARDFALVMNTRGHVYGAPRRVVAIAGIKGNGTLGAAMHLTRADAQDPAAAVIGASGLAADDVLEMVVCTDVVNGQVNETSTAEVMLNGKPLWDNSYGLWEPCELGEACHDCLYGDVGNGTGIAAADGGAGETPPLAALVFDLDDTLVDTYAQLITPLEMAAAQAMTEVDGALPDADTLAALLLDLRRSQPHELEAALQRRLPAISEDALAARRAVFTNLLPYRLCMAPEVRLFLRALGANHRLFLLTEGDPRFQHGKIDHLGLRALFDGILVVPPWPESKREAVASLLAQQQLAPEAVLLAGNRPDKEIRAGNDLGLVTVWVRRGEGSAMDPGQCGAFPDHTVPDVLALRALPLGPAALSPPLPTPPAEPALPGSAPS
jgi:FMN phosphatase YigB (HAD superfamily)